MIKIGDYVWCRNSVEELPKLRYVIDIKPDLTEMGRPTRYFTNVDKSLQGTRDYTGFESYIGVELHKPQLPKTDKISFYKNLRFYKGIVSDYYKGRI